MAKKNTDNYAIYTIPYNFIDESTMFGGMVATRNLIEGGILGFIANIPVFCIPLPLQIKLTLILVCFCVFGVLGCIGINGDPISRFVLYYVKFRKRKRIISFNGRVKFHESAADNIEFSELPRDRMLKLFNGMSKSRQSVEDENPYNSDNYVFDDDVISDEDRRNILSKLLNKKTAHIVNVKQESEDDYLYGNTEEYQQDEYEDIELIDTSMHMEFSETFDDSDYVDYDNEESQDEDYEDLQMQNSGYNNEISTESAEMNNKDFIDSEEFDNIPSFGIDEFEVVDFGVNMSLAENFNRDIDVNEIVYQTIANDPIQWQCPVCGSINDGKFCEECGSVRV